MIRKEQNIAIAVASSGIAATLLAGGRTAHSVLKLPLTFAEGQTAVCNIRKNSDKASLLRSCKLLVWDECTMAHKIALEALDRTLQDIRDDPQPMGGLVVLLAGDFRQTLPVVTRGTPADELNACLKSSYLWSHIVKMHLTVNMRVQLHNDTTAAQFADELLKIGEGQLETDSEATVDKSYYGMDCDYKRQCNGVLTCRNGYCRCRDGMIYLPERKICEFTDTVTEMEDQRICIKFCVKNGFKGAEIFWMLQTAYGVAVMSRRRVFEWYKRFKEGREETANNERSGRPSTSTTP
ncbi:hypothetical protein LAZ67_1000902 [Cordylochernes scorpioides]|uniref:ATP-dependent DNA helicase n=1 Tax=Cordylochernes scorpioides TaxID=51811 RepID=A0ABY6JXJ1_9ARAC|nr:hypothetical protein LAZ67_1000902 [Cordylochernes scorpioides]